MICVDAFDSCLVSNVYMTLTVLYCPLLALTLSFRLDTSSCCAVVGVCAAAHGAHRGWIQLVVKRQRSAVWRSGFIPRTHRHLYVLCVYFRINLFESNHACLGTNGLCAV
jgi:hypothetical protein